MFRSELVRFDVLKEQGKELIIDKITRPEAIHICNRPIAATAPLLLQTSATIDTGKSYCIWTSGTAPVDLTCPKSSSDIG
jgi:hypothetical protein